MKSNEEGDRKLENSETEDWKFENLETKELIWKGVVFPFLKYFKKIK